MTTRVGIGVSSLANPMEAAAEAASKAQRSCSAPDLVLVFVSHNHPSSALPAIRRAIADHFPSGTRVAGGTVNGVVHAGARLDALYAAQVVAVLALQSERRSMGIALLPHPGDSGDPREAGRELAREAQAALASPARAGVLLTPGLSGEPSIDPLLLEGIRAELPEIRLSGSGLCGGLDITGVPLPGWAFLDERVQHRGSLLVLFDGSRLGCSGANGLQPSGASAEITEVCGPFVTRLDGRRARDVVLDLLVGDDAIRREQMARAPAVACVEGGIGLAEERDGFAWIHLPSAFSSDGAMIDPFHPQRGMKLSVVRIDRASCMSAIEEAAHLLVQDARARAFDLVLSFSCSLRGFTLGGESANEDAELGRRVDADHQLGVIANGEIACHGAQGPFATGWVYSLFGLGKEA